jgi:Na+/H+-translocating membrane pyrophosphatase
MAPLYAALLASIIALIAALLFNAAIRRKPTGNEKMTHISEQIATGAMAFLSREY